VQRVVLRGEHRRGIDHRRVDSLPASRLPGLEDAADEAEREERPAAVVGDKVERRRRRCAAPADRVKRAREGDVVDVVPGHLCVPAALSPAGDPCVDEAPVARQARLGADAETFCYARAEALDERIRVLDQAQHRRRSIVVLQVDNDRAPSTIEEVVCRRWTTVEGDRPIDAEHVGAHVDEQHRGERAGADARDLEDA
jgi:hypothetical protein